MYKTLFLILISFSIFGQEVDEQIIYENYVLAIQNSQSTMPYFAVVKILDDDGELIREIAMESPYIYRYVAYKYDLHPEEYEKVMDLCIDNKTREFGKDLLTYIQDYHIPTYSTMEFIEFKKSMNKGKLIKEIKTTDHWIAYPKSETEQLMLAHILFNEGILTATNDCLGGGDLIHISDKP